MLSGEFYGEEESPTVYILSYWFLCGKGVPKCCCIMAVGVGKFFVRFANFTNALVSSHLAYCNSLH